MEVFFFSKLFTFEIRKEREKIEGRTARRESRNSLSRRPELRGRGVRHSPCTCITSQPLRYIMWRSELSFLSILLLLFKIRKCCDFSVRPSNEMWNLCVERWRTWTKRQEKIFLVWGGVRENRAPLPRLLCRVVLVNLVRELRELLASSLAKENEGKKSRVAGWEKRRRNRRVLICASVDPKVSADGHHNLLSLSLSPSSLYSPLYLALVLYIYII